jgi:hypothetical protein
MATSTNNLEITVLSDSESAEDAGSASESESSVVYDVNKVVDLIHDCLKGVQGFGSFSVFGSLGTPPNSGLYLTGGGGVVGLPLSELDAQAIIAVSHEGRRNDRR